MIFVDWLSVYQEYQGIDLPLLASELRTFTDVITGEVKKEQVIGYKHQGSFDSSLLIKFDKGVLSVSGNPSHWCKTDNLFGCTTVQAAIEIYNKVLKSLGYPELYDCEDTYLTSKPLAHSDGYISSGLHITRVDLTQNYISPIPAIEMLKYLSTNTYRGEAGFLYPNGKTVEWLGSRSGDTRETSKHLYFKYYCKATDIMKRVKEIEIKRNNSLVKRVNLDNDIIDLKVFKLTEQYNYLLKLLEFAIENNIVRFELELKSKKIVELGLNKLGRWSRKLMLELVTKYTPHLKQKVEFNKKIDLYNQLLDLGYPSSKAGTFSNIGQMWLDGHDINFNRNPSIKKSTYYNARTALLMLGFDIASPLNISKFPVQVQTVTMTRLEKPSWYREAA